jgi:predicted nucleic acid-binding protein
MKSLAPSPLIVVDTNVIVSALLKADSMPAMLLGSILSGRQQIAVDARILLEYRDVLGRPAFRFDQTLVGVVLEALEYNALTVAARPLARQLPDLADCKFLEVAAAVTPPAVLVTGNLRHFPVVLCGVVSVLSPRAFLDLYHSRG